MSEDQDVDVQAQQLEREARKQGWRPQEEFRGDPDDWVDAPTYIRRGKEIRAHSKAENERLQSALAAANAQISEMRGTIDEIREYHAQMEERAINAALDRMKKERRAAVAEGNTELAAEIDEEIQELKDAPRLAKTGKKDDAAGTGGGNANDQGQQQQPDPAVTRWIKDNDHWYNAEPQNEDLVALANGVAGAVMNRKDLTVEQKLEEIDRRVKAAFPDRFGGASRRTSTTAGAGEGGGSTRRSNDPVASLPQEARQAGERFVKQGLYKDMKEYAAEYWKQPGARA